MKDNLWSPVRLWAPARRSTVSAPHLPLSSRQRDAAVETSQTTAYEVKIIPVNLIDDSGPDPSRQGKPNKEKDQELARSVRSHKCLFHPVGVRPVEGTDRYELIFGRRRLRAVREILKLGEIEAKIFTGITDADAEMAAIDENLWQKPLSKVEYYAALAKWSKLYEAKHPETKGYRAGAIASKKVRAERKAQGSGSPPGMSARSTSQGDCHAADPASPGLEPNEEPAPSRAEALASATGQSKSSAGRDIRVAESFNAEQLAAMDARGLTKTDLYTLAKIKNDEERSWAVNLAASGMEVEEAIATARRKAAESETGKKPAAGQTGNDRPDDTQTHAEWIAKYCRRLRDRLGANTAAFDRSAALYRDTMKERKAFKKNTERAVAKSVDGSGSTKRRGLARMIDQLCALNHPRDWHVCGACNGSGQKNPAVCIGGPSPCENCRGEGFKLSWESPR